MMERRLAALEGTEACIAHVERHERDPAARHGPAQGRRPRRLLAERVRLDGDAVRPRVRQVRRRDELRLADRRRRVARRDAAEHEAAVRRVADQSAHRGVRHPRAGRHRPRRAARCSPSTTASARRRCSGRSSYGADFVIHSGTKYLDGQGRVIAGALCAQRGDRQRQVRAGDAQRRHDALAVQRLGRAEGPRDALDPHGGAERARAGAGALARGAAGRSSASTIPGLASHPQHALAMAQQSGSGGAVVSFIVARAQSGGRGGAQERVPRHRQHARLLDHRQPRRHQDDDHASGEHLARPPQRGAAARRRHHAGDDPRRDGPRRRRRHPGRPRARPRRRCERHRIGRRRRCARPARPHPHRAVADRLPPPRHRAHRAVLVGVRAPPRRRVRAAHRGHRRRALDARPRSSRSSTSMRWLGLDYDEGPIYQMQRLERYREVAEQHARRGQGLPLLRDAGRARGDARGAARARREAALRRPLAARAGQDAAADSATASRR